MVVDLWHVVLVLGGYPHGQWRLVLVLRVGHECEVDQKPACEGWSAWPVFESRAASEDVGLDTEIWGDLHLQAAAEPAEGGGPGPPSTGGGA